MAWMFRSRCALVCAVSLIVLLSLADASFAQHELPEYASADVNPTSVCEECFSDCDCADDCDTGCGLNVYGWLDAGYIYNTGNPRSHFNGPYNSQDQNIGMFNQAYFIAEKQLTNDYGADFGARVDMLYGWDYFLGQSVGLEQNPDGSDRWNSSEYYGLALPQIYGEVGNKELSVKLGHWYSIVGFEGLPATSSFFYTKSYSYQFAGPFTHWGGIATWQADDNWQVQGGLHNGWNQLDGTSDHMGVIGGLKYTNDCQDFWSSFAITAGSEYSNLAGLPTVDDAYTNRVRYSWIVDKKLSNRTEYVFHHWLGVQQDGAPDGGNALWYGIDQYLFYTLNSTHKLATRFEWFRDEDGTRVGLNRPSNPNKPPLPGNYFSWTVGDNWTPGSCQNLMVRPELRWDFYDGPAKPYADGTKEYQLLLGFDVVWSF